MNKPTNYNFIFKSTFLFGSVKVFLILSKIGLSKAVSILLGPTGVGLMGLYESTIQLIATFSGLGISQSTIRDISEVNETKNETKISRIISLTNGLVLYSALFGFIITILFSSLFSFLTFGDTTKKFSFIFLSFAIFFTIMNQGRLAVLKGSRKLNSVALSLTTGSIFSFLIGFICYYTLGFNGIVPALISIPLILFIISNYYVGKIKFKKIKLSLSDYFSDGFPILKMGLSLMYVSLSIVISEYVIKTYILNNSTIEMVGFFHAGTTLIMGYFGLITNAMATDYYPRVSAINRDNIKLSHEVNRQSRVALILLGPLVVLFLFLMPFLVELVYSKQFLPTTDYLGYAIFGVIFISCSNLMHLILLAKQKPSIFLFTVTFNRFVLIATSLYLFNYFSLKGLGVSFLIFSIFEFILLQIVLTYFYNIKINFETIKILSITLLLSLFSFLSLQIESLILHLIVGLILFTLSGIYSLNIMRNMMDIDLLKIIKKK